MTHNFIAQSIVRSSDFGARLYEMAKIRDSVLHT